MPLSLTGASRAIVAAAMLAGASATQALTVPAVYAYLDSTSYKAAFSSSADGFDPTTLATNIHVYSSPVQTAFAKDWTSPVNASEPGFFDYLPSGGSADASGEFADSTDDTLVNVDRYGEFTLGAGQSITASINYSLSRDPLYQPSRAWAELQVLGLDGDQNFTRMLAESTKSLAYIANSEDSENGTLTVSFTNVGAGAETFRLTMNANTAIGVSAVPEPTSAAMLMAGGLSLTMLAMRRRRR